MKHSTSTILTGGGLSRRRFLQAVAGLSLSVAGLELLDACGSQPGTSGAEEGTLETTTIRLGDAIATCYAPMYMAEEPLRREGFTEVQYVKVEPTIGKDLASGQADIGMLLSAPFIIQVDAGDPVVQLAGVHVGCFELFGTDQVSTISDLKGKTVAVYALGGPPHVFLASMVAYVGLDPNQDINWVIHTHPEAKQLLAEGKLDAYITTPTNTQELRAEKIGHVVVNTMMDKPWSQYFCCMATANREFVQKNPVATKRALRGLLKGTDLCVHEPERAAQLMVDRGVTENYDYALEAMQMIPYNKWQEYDSEDTLRFWALRLREAGFIKSSPDEIIAQGADWRFLNEIKAELKG